MPLEYNQHLQVLPNQEVASAEDNEEANFEQANSLKRPDLSFISLCKVESGTGVVTN